MADRQHSVPPDVFDEKYRTDPDPWNYRSSSYEQEKYAASITVLGDRRYQSALEIGCSIGVFTTKLASLCDSLLAVDAAPLAVERCRERCGHLGNVHVERMQVPRQFPSTSFDLIVLSEVGYYLSQPDLVLLRMKIIEQLEPSGRLLLVHWTPAIDDAPLTGDEVHQIFAEAGKALESVLHRREATYRLDLFQKRQVT